jgi:hypothetical protein
VRKALVLAIASLFFYSLFRDMTLFKTLVLCVAIAAAYGISKIPTSYVAGAKYPLIGVSLALCPVFIIYPWLRHHFLIAASVMFLAFYSMAFFLVTLDEKGKKMYKEVIGLFVLYGVSSLNLFFTGHPELILPLSISVLVFLFIMNKVEIMPFMAGCATLVLILLLVSGVHVVGPAVRLQAAERYVLLASAFALLLLVFAAYLKRPDFATIVAFFGLIYISIDLLMSVGFSLKGVLLNQPLLGLFIVGPIVGMALKGGRERL